MKWLRWGGAALLVLAGCGGDGERRTATASVEPPTTESTAPAGEPVDSPPSREATEDGTEGGEASTSVASEDPAAEDGAEETAAGVQADADPFPPEETPWERTPVARIMRVPASHSTSLGGPSTGTLEGGVPLPDDAPGLRSNPIRPNPHARWGTAEMVQALVRAAAAVREAHGPDSEVTINDVSHAEGGPLTHHGSHQAGRDVDVLFYLLDEDGNPRRGRGVPIDPEGVGWDFGDLADPSDDVKVRIDIPRTWAFLEALAGDPDARLQRIYVVEHVRTMLMEHAERIGAPWRARQLIGVTTCQPGAPHDDHLHIRFFCSPEDIEAGCEDAGPIYGFHRRELGEAGVEPVRARRDRRRRRARTVSREEAREQAEAEQELHPRVVAFLERRETWAEKPSPGRPFCR